MDLTPRSILGYAFIVIGILLVLFSLYTGYNIYTNVAAQVAYGALLAPQTSNSGLNGALTALGGLSSQMQVATALFAEIFLLFLFATIGFKMAELGMHLTREHEK